MVLGSYSIMNPLTSCYDSESVVVYCSTLPLMAVSSHYGQLLSSKTISCFSLWLPMDNPLIGFLGSWELALLLSLGGKIELLFWKGIVLWLPSFPMSGEGSSVHFARSLCWGKCYGVLTDLSHNRVSCGWLVGDIANMAYITKKLGT